MANQSSSQSSSQSSLSSSDHEFCLPGFDIPLGRLPNPPEDMFPNALNSQFDALITTQREFTMMMIMDRITDRKGWEEKVFDEEIANKWRAELVNNEHNSNDGENDGWESRDITNEMVDWCFAELKYKAELLPKIGCVESLDGIFKSDTIVSNDLREALIKAVLPLENVPDRDKDWHPGSENQVLDLVHPSMYPLVYGQSKILVDQELGLDDCISRCGNGETLTMPTLEKAKSRIDKAWSTKFQWLPSELEILEIPSGGQDVRIITYINNLHPQTHKSLYSVIEQVVAQAIPLWNLTLTPLKLPYRVALRMDINGDGYEDDIEQHENRSSPPGKDSNENDQDYNARLLVWRNARKNIRYPQPEQFKPPEQRYNESSKDFKYEDNKYVDSMYEDFPLVDLRKDFGRLQIIVKLASIYLTPEKPAYDGESWHAEGQLNENICSTALYFYETENIFESLLSFRRPVDPFENIQYADGDFRAVETIYGIDAEGPGIQEMGNVVTKEGRLLTFPNVLQHRVAPFRLSDPTKPGHRKILAIFLIDPHHRIISTAHVPCQQKAIWADEVRNIEPLRSLPPELVNEIINYEYDFPVSLDVAEDQRLELMHERSTLIENHNRHFYTEHNFNLCE